MMIEQHEPGLTQVPRKGGQFLLCTGHSRRLPISYDPFHSFLFVHESTRKCLFKHYWIEDKREDPQPQLMIKENRYHELLHINYYLSTTNKHDDPYYTG